MNRESVKIKEIHNQLFFQSQLKGIKAEQTRRRNHTFIMKKRLYIILSLILLISCQNKPGNFEFEDGDIIFQTSKSKQSKAIQIATKSKYTHMGVIYKKENEYYVYEAVQPVKLTQLKKWINNGENGKYVVKRLKNSQTILTPDNLLKMKKIGNKFMGKNYDIYFEWSDERIYCSELVWKIYKRAIGVELGKPEKLKDFDLSNEIVSKMLKERFGNNIPLNESVISPSAIFNSDKLITVYQN